MKTTTKLIAFSLGSALLLPLLTSPSRAQAQTTTAPAASTYLPIQEYNEYMRLGYDATQNGNYTRAMRFFESAMTERPDDAYAVQAIRNVQAYMTP